MLDAVLGTAVVGKALRGSADEVSASAALSPDAVPAGAWLLGVSGAEVGAGSADAVGVGLSLGDFDGSGVELGVGVGSATTSAHPRAG